MDFGIIIFSRFDSSRLPGKATIDIEGKTLLQRVIDRAKLVDNSVKVIVATSDRKIESPIIECALKQEVEVFQGNLNNVAQRALDCAKHFSLERFARVCGDRAFVPHELISDYFQWSKDEDLDLATNVIGKSFPPGFTTEIVKTSALESLLSSTTSQEDLEHVTKYFYSNIGHYKVGNRKSTIDYGDISLVVDNERDLNRARFIAKELGANPEKAEMSRVISAAKKWYEENSKQS